MRNSKVKGFTLIELIVVIAIIGILAAILVPSMLGYVRNARISSANANAKQVHTAISSALTQLGIQNATFTGTAGAAGELKITIADAATGVGAGTGAQIPVTDITAVTVGGAAVGNVPDAFDLVSYLGENFTGNGLAYFNESTYSVICAAWTADTAFGGNMSSVGNAAAVTGITEAQQKSDAKNGDLYGIYPQPPIA